MNEGIADIQAVLAEYVAAVLAKDPARLAAIYAPDVRVFDLWGTWSYDGRAAWQGCLDGWLGSLGDESVRVAFDDVRIIAQSELGSVSATISYGTEYADGRPRPLDAKQAVLGPVQDRRALGRDPRTHLGADRSSNAKADPAVRMIGIPGR